MNGSHRRTATVYRCGRGVLRPRQSLARTACLLACVLAAASATADDAIATVDGTSITSEDVRVFLALRGVTGEVAPAMASQTVDVLIERELIRTFLERNKTEADPAELAEAVRQRWERKPAGRGGSVPTLEELGVDESRLSSELAVPMAWRRHVTRVVGEEQIREHFEKNRSRLDGTRLRISQIFRKHLPGEAPGTATATIAALQVTRDAIERGDQAFEAAARESSEAPSAAAGGDVGWIGPRGDLPATVSDAAYRLKPGELSGVVESPFGVHLVQITETRPGDLSLEDVRPVVIEELSRLLWVKTVAEERKSARIERKEPVTPATADEPETPLVDP